MMNKRTMVMLVLLAGLLVLAETGPALADGGPQWHRRRRPPMAWGWVWLESGAGVQLGFSCAAHVPADVVPPPTVTDVRGCRGEEGLELQCCPTDPGITRESGLVAVVAQSSPATVEHRIWSRFRTSMLRKLLIQRLSAKTIPPPVNRWIHDSFRKK